MKDEIRQNGQVILSSDDDISIPIIYNNLVGVNMQGVEYRDYLKHVAMEGSVMGRFINPVLFLMYKNRTDGTGRISFGTINVTSYIRYNEDVPLL